jgi:hypothetical protein
MTEDERLSVIEIESMQALFGKMAHQIQCADIIIHHSETKSACESNPLCRRPSDTLSSLCTGERLVKNAVDLRSETDAAIQDYNVVLDTLMQRFRDNAVRDTFLDVRDIGKRASRWL